MAVFDPIGSTWRRWDPHLHAPGTLLSDQFYGNWQEYLNRIESAQPMVEALGVTDYFCIQTYREVKKLKTQGRLNHVKLLFPNVEMRLDIKTEKGKAINLHLLFSPDESDHEQQIERILANFKFEYGGRNYCCTIPELTQLGKVFDPKQTDENGALRKGANLFKVSLRDIRELFRAEKWMRENCLIAIAGKQTDGTSGLQRDDSFEAVRREIEMLSHIIFDGSQKQRDFWLGKQPHADSSFIEQTYGNLKPCLHGSDAHREEMVLSPELERCCWLKGDISFETLKQILIEPEERVFIGPNPPNNSGSPFCIKKFVLKNATWTNSDDIMINPGLVAVIGPRGSGKTALVDMIAASAGVPILSETSFLHRASNPVNFLGNSAACIEWGDGSKSEAILSDSIEFIDGQHDMQEVRYLSQHFVESLCSSAGLATDLRDEMERVIFEATDPIDRLESDSFSSMSRVYLEPIQSRRNELQNSIHSIGEQILGEDELIQKLPELKREEKSLHEQILKTKKEIETLLPKGKEQRANQLAELEQACSKVEAKIEMCRKRQKLLCDLADEVLQIKTHREPERYNKMKNTFKEVQIDEKEWDSFKLNFTGDVEEIINARKILIEEEINVLMNGVIELQPVRQGDHSKERSLKALRESRDRVKKEVGIDIERQKKYDNMQKDLLKLNSSLRRVEAGIQNAQGAEERRKILVHLRREKYTNVAETIIEEEKTLASLYAPLEKSLKGSSGVVSKLAFVVKRNIDIARWVKSGESLFDLRRESKFKGHGSLKREAKTYLYGAWQRGDAENISQAIDGFRSDFSKEFLQAMPLEKGNTEKGKWLQGVGDWLYSTDHIEVAYGIQYDGVDIEQLSPGTRGIVLLLLYLVIDQHDRRPLIIDQPEENLDPNSIYQELVPHFRAARKRRQVIIVTHNANLVVNTDADQIITAESTQNESGGLPFIKYRSGSLENPDIRKSVCQLLEGGERAFLDRERRYRIKWGVN
jgi:energy-coupling factor transporter ATP-binding protein EcfA2